MSTIPFFYLAWNEIFSTRKLPALYLWSNRSYVDIGISLCIKDCHFPKMEMRNRAFPVYSDTFCPVIVERCANVLKGGQLKREFSQECCSAFEEIEPL